MTSASLPRRRIGAVGRLPRLLVIAGALTVAGGGALMTGTVSLALLTGQANAPAVFGAKTVFPAERITPAFVIGDASSGAVVDRSSSFAVAGDALTTTTTSWSSAFDAARYVEFDVNDSLPSGLDVSGATFNMALASAGAGQACVYLEVRIASSGAVIETIGGPGSPVGCVSGSTLTTFSTPLPSVQTTTRANDLRIRVFGSESVADSIVIDLATVTGSTPYSTFTLYPVVFRDAADATVTTIPWQLDAP